MHRAVITSPRAARCAVVCSFVFICSEAKHALEVVGEPEVPCVESHRTDERPAEGCFLQVMLGVDVEEIISVSLGPRASCIGSTFISQAESFL